jgi:hypothetical protein
MTKLRRLYLILRFFGVSGTIESALRCNKLYDARHWLWEYSKQYTDKELTGMIKEKYRKLLGFIPDKPND